MERGQEGWRGEEARMWKEKELFHSLLIHIPNLPPPNTHTHALTHTYSDSTCTLHTHKQCQVEVVQTRDRSDV